MPATDGIEFLEAVREDHPELPFILYTGKGSEEVASDAISAGVTDYLQKGTGSEQYELLANRIRNAVEAHESHRLLTERTRRLETLIDNLPGMVYRCRNAPAWPMETVEGRSNRSPATRPTTWNATRYSGGRTSSTPTTATRCGKPCRTPSRTTARSRPPTGSSPTTGRSGGCGNADAASTRAIRWSHSRGSSPTSPSERSAKSDSNAPRPGWKRSSRTPRT
ncbi:response regulator [Halobellus limi]|uniref:Response regulator n=1 Tax=Halobellus limi TaxID=699433 RepID=A0A4D6H725_9EURY|nr:response regulator [Halobellus limi]